jgi:hypothetical protein
MGSDPAPLIGTKQGSAQDYSIFNQIVANKANFHNFMVKINSLLGRVVDLLGRVVDEFVQHWQNPNEGIMASRFASLYHKS